MTGWVLRWRPIGVVRSVGDDGLVINETRNRTMQQDRRHRQRRADRQALRDALANHGRPPTRGGQGMPSRDADRRRGRGRAPWRLSPGATAQPACGVAHGAVGGRPKHGVRGKTRVRGAALLDVMFTLAALMAGAQGFSQWQAAGAMSSAELASSTKAVATAGMARMALPAALPALSALPALPAHIGSDAWHVRRHP